MPGSLTAAADALLQHMQVNPEADIGIYILYVSAHHGEEEQ